MTVTREKEKKKSIIHALVSKVSNGIWIFNEEFCINYISISGPSVNNENVAFIRWNKSKRVENVNKWNKKRGGGGGINNSPFNTQIELKSLPPHRFSSMLLDRATDISRKTNKLLMPWRKK